MSCSASSLDPIYLFAAIGTRSLANSVGAATKKTTKGNIYSRLGVRSLNNARGTWTYLSGSLEQNRAW